MPRFSLDDCAALLNQLRVAGYRWEYVSQLKLSSPLDRIAYIRHDVDLHIRGIDQLARLEADQGVHATYYVCLAMHFNVLYAENRRILRSLRDLGHEIGLHYDLETYPAGPADAREHLGWEVGILERIIDVPIKTISLHAPHRGRPDPFSEIDECVNAMDPRYLADLLYVSDSCRAWSDESLLRCFGSDAPRRLMLNLHPELWLDGRVVDRMGYLNNVLAVNGIEQHRDFFERVVGAVWTSHPAPRLHDERESRR
jgi:hypothetical protein